MQEKSPIKQRILQFIDLQGISVYVFYKLTGITRGVLDKKNGISEVNIAKFLAYYNNVNPSWLLTGKGQMIRKNDILESNLVSENEVEYKKYCESCSQKDKEIDILNGKIEALNNLVKELFNQKNDLAAGEDLAKTAS